jgi:hypothetical protein
MIKTIPLELDGFYYNIIQMSGKQAWTMKLTILNAFPEIIKDIQKINGSNESDATNAVLEIIASVFMHFKAATVIPIVEELLKTIKYIDGQSNKAMIEANGYDSGRHGLGVLVHIDQFTGKDAYHLPIIIYQILKANYTDFFVQLKPLLGSNFGQNIRNLI